MVVVVTRRTMDPLQQARPGKAAQGYSRIGSSLAEIRGDGPVAKRGNKIVPVSDGCPLIGTRPTSASTHSATYVAVTWNEQVGESGDAVWTSTSVATIGTMGWYDLDAIVGMGVSATNKTVNAKWQRNIEDLTGAPAHESTSAFRAQVRAWEPWVRLNPGDTVRVMAMSESASDTWRESRCAIRLVKEITDMPNTVGVGSTITCGPIGETWLTRDAASASIADTLTDVAVVTDCKPGLYHFEYHGVYQTTATTTGVGFAAAFTGTATGYAEQRHATTGGAAATAAATGAGASATGNLYEAQGQRTLGSLIGAVTVSVDAANTDTRVTVEGDFNVTVIGNFSIKQRAESAGLACSARVGSVLILRKLS